MKKTLVILMSIYSLGVQAKVSDFNALINDNMKEQSQLHNDVKTSVGETQAALNPKESSTVMVETAQASINSPTGKNMLRFRKEMVSHETSERTLEKRLANEFKDADMEF